MSKIKRSLSQIQFGYLPQQTVDAQGGIWKVVDWSNAETRSNIDERSLKSELRRLSGPWAATGRDGGYLADMSKRTTSVVLKLINRDRGVHLKPFPEIWYCGNCYRIHDQPEGGCKCGSPKRRGQLQFVAYSESTGELKEPNIARCQSHGASRIHLPGTATGSEVTFDCPDCGTKLGGFRFTRASNGDRMHVNVHRAAAVFTPRNVVVVNPPSLETLRSLEDAGGGPRALEWLLDGMPGKSMLDGKPTTDGLRRQLAASGLDPGTIEKMLLIAASADEVASGPGPSGLTGEVKSRSEEEAMKIALGVSESRSTLKDLVDGTDPLSPLRHRYDVQYREALHHAGLERVELVEKFPILSGHFGYTRGPSEAGASQLIPYYDRKRGAYEIYGDISETEALFVGLDPVLVAEWLGNRGHGLKLPHSSAKDARLGILGRISGVEDFTDEVYRDVVTLIHSYSHRLIRLTAVNAGIEVHALSELLVPLHLGFFVYAATRGDFVLGGLQALFENDLNLLLNEFVEGEHRCALDPGCSKSGGACVACLHLGEPSCRLFNTRLDRSVLAGPGGFLGLRP